MIGRVLIRAGGFGHPHQLFGGSLISTNMPSQSSELPIPCEIRSVALVHSTREMEKPDIVFVPGFWEGPEAFDGPAEQLRDAGYVVHSATLLSTGVPYSTEPKSPGLKDDIAHIRSFVSALVRPDREILMVPHSAGGFLGSGAVEGLTTASRQKEGLKGGVSHIAFLTAGVLPEGALHPDLPFVEKNEV